MNTNPDPSQRRSTPISVHWLPAVSADTQDLTRWITIPAGTKDFWSFPRTRLINCTWSQSGSVELEFLTHRFELEAITPEDLATKILSGQTSLLQVEGSFQPEWFVEFPLDNCETIYRVNEFKTDPAYEFLSKNA